jgi:hypothetical protein
MPFKPLPGGASFKYKPALGKCRITVETPHLALKDVDFDSFLLLVLRRIAFLAHGLSAHLDAVSIGCGFR